MRSSWRLLLPQRALRPRRPLRRLLRSLLLKERQHRLLPQRRASSPRRPWRPTRTSRPRQLASLPRRPVSPSPTGPTTSPRARRFQSGSTTPRSLQRTRTAAYSAPWCQLARLECWPVRRPPGLRLLPRWSWLRPTTPRSPQRAATPRYPVASGGTNSGDKSGSRCPATILDAGSSHMAAERGGDNASVAKSAHALRSGRKL